MRVEISDDGVVGDVVEHGSGRDSVSASFSIRNSDQDVGPRDKVRRHFLNLQGQVSPVAAHTQKIK